MSDINTNTNKKPDPKMVEMLHDMCKMPDRAYYQLNGKSAQENYADQKRKMQQRFMEQETDVSDVHVTSEVSIKK